MNKKLTFSPTNASNKLRVSARNDFIWAVVAIAVLVTISVSLDIEILESLYDYTREHEEYELDEFFIVFIWTSLVAVIYGIRRMKDIRGLNKDISNHAYYDSITQLPNRRLAIQKLNILISNASRYQKEIAVLFLDFDNFKVVNDTYGHAQGDLLIKSVGERLSNEIREGDTLARLGGDEFVLLIEANNSEADIMSTLTRIVESAHAPHSILGHDIFVNYSIGVATYPKDALTTGALLRAADVAMYKAKEKGKGRFYIYSEELGEKLALRYKLEHGIENAISAKQLSLVFQPQVNIQEQRISGYEALLRWDFNGENIPPDIFIKIAEETRVIESIGQWVLKQALIESKPWIKDDMLIAVNISPKQLQMPNFVDSVCTALKESKVTPQNLELEITETALLTDFENVLNKLKKLKEMGISIAIDDFGTGYSSLARLKDLPVNKLKIDRSFVVDLDRSINNQNIIKAIFSLADNLNLTTVIEGVETAQQLAILKPLGVCEMQGYYFSKPLASDKIDALEIAQLHCVEEYIRVND